MKKFLWTKIIIFQNPLRHCLEGKVEHASQVNSTQILLTFISAFQICGLYGQSICSAMSHSHIISQTYLQSNFPYTGRI